MGATRAATNKAIRQDALREQLAEQCRLQHVIDNIEKIEALEIDTKGDKNEIDYKDLQVKQFTMNKLKTANDQRLKLISKYLPDLKQQEIFIEADVVAKDKTRKELEEKLLAAGIDIELLDG